MPESNGSSNASGGGSNTGGSSQSDSSSQNDGSSSGQEQDKNWLEWTVLAIGLAITLGVIGYMGFQAIAGSNEPADIQVTLKEQTVDGDFVIITLEAVNEGDRVAEGAMIEVCSGPDSCGEVSFAYIPQGSKRSGVIGLNAPLEAPLTTRVVSFRKP